MLAIYNKYPKDMVKRILSDSHCELEPTFAGFLDNYIHLARMIPKHFTILDIGCYRAAQCWFFRNHAAYVGVDLGEEERFRVDNTTHYIGEASEWIENHHHEFPDATFVIMNLVPSHLAEEKVRKYFSNMFIYYPQHDSNDLLDGVYMKIKGYEQYFHGKENKITSDKLKAGEDCVVIGYGQSMTPIMKSGQPAFVEHLTDETNLEKNDIVFCKVNGRFYLHKIIAVKGESYMIGNNHGHINGTVSRKNIFGKVTKIL